VIPTGAPRRRLATLALALVTIGTVVVMGAGTASADNPLVSSSPAADSTVEQSPTSIALTFTSSVGSQNTVVAACNGQTIPLGAPTIGPDGVTLNVPVVQPLPAGDCSVSWTVSNPDATVGGSGTIAFTIAGPVDTTPTTTPGTGTATPDAGTTPATTLPATGGSGGSTDDGSNASVEGPLGLGRLIMTIGLAAMFGALVLIVLAWPEGVEYILTVRFLRVAWGLAVVGAYLTTAGLAAKAAGESFAYGLSPTSWTELTDGIPQLAALARMALTVACIWVVLRPERVTDPVTRAAALGLPAAAVATLGLSRDEGDLVMLGYAAGISHALAMAVWFGGLALLVRVVLSGPGEIDLVHAVTGFSRLANVAIGVTVVTGGIQLWRLDGGEILTSGHGRVILLKSLVVAGMVFVGVATRQWALANLARADHMSAASAARLRRAVGIETALGVGVLLLTSWALSFQPSNVDATSSGPAVGDPVLLSNGQYDMTVALTQQVGPNALVVTVTRADAPLTDLTIELLPPPGSAGVGIVQPIPLTEPGTAALGIDDGLPINVPGVWTVAARVGGVAVDSKNITFEAPPTP
jgi:putative copper export protein/methionine-rich copper-binding protein CopC